jgi:hypothetical protein
MINNTFINCTKLTGYLLTFALICFGLNTFAYFHSNCVEAEYSLLSSKIVYNSECKIAIPLNLTETYYNYPKMTNNPWRVEVWEGSYEKTLKIENIYLKELINICRGRVISEKQIKVTKKKVLEFTINNPNLNTSISKSYLLAPMSNQEARNELTRAWQRCQRPTEEYIESETKFKVTGQSE